MSYSFLAILLSYGIPTILISIHLNKLTINLERIDWVATAALLATVIASTTITYIFMPTKTIEIESKVKSSNDLSTTLKLKQFLKLEIIATVRTICITLGIALTLYSLAYVPMVFGKKNFISILTQSKGCWVSMKDKPEQLTLAEEEMLVHFIKKGLVLSHDQILNSVSSFYNTLISVLLVALTLVGALVYISIKGFTRKDVREIASDQISKDLETYKNQMVTLQDSLLKGIEPKYNEKLEELLSSDQSKISEMIKNGIIDQFKVKNFLFGIFSDPEVFSLDYIPELKNYDSRLTSVENSIAQYKSLNSEIIEDDNLDVENGSVRFSVNPDTERN